MIEVELDRPATGAARVAFTHEGRARPEVDFHALTSSPLVFAAGDQVRTIELEVIDKRRFFQAVELFTRLHDPIGLLVDPRANVVLTAIRPAAPPPGIGFASSTSSAASGGAFSIPLRLDSASAADVRVHFELAGSVAAAEVTLPASGAVLIPAGETQAELAGSLSARVRAGQQLALRLTHESGEVVPELALRRWPSKQEFVEQHADENAITFSDPRDIEQHLDSRVSGAPAIPGVPSAWGPGGTAASGPPGSPTARFINQEHESPLTNPFTGQPHRIYAFTEFIVNGTPYVRESFADSYCDGPVLLGNPPLAEAELEKSPFGVNATRVAGGIPQDAFVDAMKGAAAWEHVLSGSSHVRDPGTISGFDQNGWPLLRGSEAAFTRLYWGGGPDGFPSGEYRVSWKGSGTLLFGPGTPTGFSVVGVTDEGANAKTILVDNSIAGGIYLRIDSSSPVDPLRDIRVLQPGHSEAQRRVFTPRFLERCGKFGTLRMTEWQRTSRSPLVEWSERARPEHFSYATARGVPLEIQLELAAETESDAWLNLPHQASDDYVRRFAQLVRETLPPLCRVYVEYGHELWNPAFAGGEASQYDYALARAEERGLGGTEREKRLRFCSERSVEVFELCDAVWRGPGSSVRRTRVLGSDASDLEATRLLLTHGEAYEAVDMLALAGLIGSQLGKQLATESLAEEDLLAVLGAERASLFAPEPAGSNLAAHQSLAAEYTNLEGRPVALGCYAAGQSLRVQRRAAGGPEWADEEALIARFHELNRSDPLGRLYEMLFADWQALAASGSGPLCLLSFLTPYVEGRGYDGSDGLMESVEQPESEAPKWRALLSTLASRPIWNPPARGNLARHHRISYYVALPIGADAKRAEGVEYAQISLRNRSKSLNHLVTFRLNFPGTEDQLGRDGQPVEVCATSIGNVGEWFAELGSSVTPMEYGVVEDAFGVRIWMTHHCDGETLYEGLYANIGDVDDDGRSEARGAWPDRPYVDNGNPILRPAWTDASTIAALGGIEQAVGKGLILYGCMHERSDRPLSGAPGPYRRRPRHWWEPEGLATLSSLHESEHVVTIV